MADTTQTFRSGLWNGVRNTTEPFDDTPNLLQDATNIVIPDPQAGSGAFGRPAFRRFYPRGGTIPATSYPPFGQVIDGVGYYNGQCVYGTAEGISIFFSGGVMYLTNYPFFVSKINISSFVCVDLSNPIFVTQIGKQLVVTDSKFQPWAYNTADGTCAMIDAFPAVVNLRTDDTVNTSINVAAHQVQLLSATGMPTSYNLTATAVALPAGTIAKDKWGAFRVTYTVAGGFAITAAPNNAAGYATEALAIAGLDAATPAVPVSSSVWNEGYFTLRADAPHDFVAGTTPLILAGAYPPGHCQSLNYYAGRAAPWSATANPVVYTGAVFFIYKSGGPSDPMNAGVDAASKRTIIWSEPNDPFTGYQQTDYDNAWTLAQTSTEYLNALAATNLALYYFRSYSIGAIQGAPGVDFRNTATNDSVSFNIGSKSPGSICQFGQWLYFADAKGRTYRFSYGSAPEKIWLQARAVYEDTSPLYQNNGEPIVAMLDPNLNVYVVFPFSGSSSVGLAYDAPTGQYLGKWTIANGSTAANTVGVLACGVLRSVGTNGVVACVLGYSDTTNVSAGYLWGLLSLNRTEWGWGDVPLYADSVAPSTTIGQVVNVKTNRLGYSTVANYTLGQVRLVLDSNVASVPAAGVDTVITVTTPTGVYTEWSAATAPDSYDGVNLLTFVGSGQIGGRGLQIIAQNAQTATQWVCYRVEADVVAGRAYTGER